MCDPKRTICCFNYESKILVFYIAAPPYATTIKMLSANIYPLPSRTGRLLRRNFLVLPDLILYGKHTVASAILLSGVLILLIFGATMYTNERPKELTYAQNTCEIGSSYVCWCDTTNSSKVQWEQPNSRNGLIILIFGALTIIPIIISFFPTYKFCKQIKRHQMR
ncbi:unnamed protein product [Rotaria magnacalcarata]|uniref:Uncharacterized protein n=1 Tax=Rotaria magnacalcarata TaxID=392030 RepID=A0A8S2MN12_9BILA|nr:unnamed protein product [Rotaria magnacalcarata]